MILRVKMRAFTMIEMLMVILIIGILAALILPAVIKARDKAMDTECRSNLKNLHQAAMNHLYYYGCLPSSRSWEYYFFVSGTVGWYQNWGWCAWRDWTPHGTANTIRPGKPDPWWGQEAVYCITSIYTTILKNSDQDGSPRPVICNTLWEFVGKNIKVYSCPKFKKMVNGQKAPDNTTTLTEENIFRTYVMNYNAGGIMDRVGNVGGLSLGMLQNASKMLLFADAHTHYTNQAPNRAGTSNVRICRFGLMEGLGANQSPQFYAKGAAYANGHYIQDATYINDFGGPAAGDSWNNPGAKYRACSYDSELYGRPDWTAVPIRSYPVESVGIHHGYVNINGKSHPFGYGVFIDGHVEQLCWWQTTNACSGNW